MKISVVGLGYVGLVTAACLAEGGNDVICVDSDGKKIRDLSNGLIPIFEPGLSEIVARNLKSSRLTFTADLNEAIANSLLIFISVATPTAADNSADISAVLNVASKIAELMTGYRIIVTKSTVPVGTHRLVSDLIRSKTGQPFDYVSNPEFLKEGSAVDDFLKPARVIVGTASPAVMEIMREIYSPYIRKSNRIIYMDPASAEMTKYAANLMLASRISLMNELSALCEVYSADIEQVRAGIGSDPRIGNNYLYAGVGYGGSCFPKDIRALIHMGETVGMSMTIAQAVQEVNLNQHRRFASRVIEYFSGRQEVQVGVWGIAFKARTADIRESPAVFCIEKFVEAGLRVVAYDPGAMPVAREKFGDKIKMVENGYDVLDNSCGLVVLTDWNEFRAPDFEQIAKRLKKPIIIDGRNLYNPRLVRRFGIEYHSIGRPDF